MPSGFEETDVRNTRTDVLRRRRAGRRFAAGALVLLTLAPVPAILDTASAQMISSKREVAVLQAPFGKIVLELYPDTAPKHVAAFKKNIRDGVYNGTLIHKISPGFVIKGGDPFTKDAIPANDGWGGFGPPIPNEYSDAHKNIRGALGALRKPDSVNVEQAWNGFQFYIALADLPSLDAGKHTVFGRVIEGMDVVDRIAAMGRDDKTGVPKDRIEFKRVYLEER
jgi:cyclophilin family peptidyl-prolyl cis-trans isomerase